MWYVLKQNTLRPCFYSADRCLGVPFWVSASTRLISNMCHSFSDVVKMQIKACKSDFYILIWFLIKLLGFWSDVTARVPADAKIFCVLNEVWLRWWVRSRPRADVFFFRKPSQQSCFFPERCYANKRGFEWVHSHMLSHRRRDTRRQEVHDVAAQNHMCFEKLVSWRGEEKLCW